MSYEKDYDLDSELIGDIQMESRLWPENKGFYLKYWAEMQ